MIAMPMNNASTYLGWSNDVWLEIGLALLMDESRTLTAPEIERRTGRSNAKRSAAAMVIAGLLEERPPAAQGGPGRRATIAFHLAPAGCRGSSDAKRTTSPRGAGEARAADGAR